MQCLSRGRVPVLVLALVSLLELSSAKNVHRIRQPDTEDADNEADQIVSQIDGDSESAKSAAKADSESAKSAAKTAKQAAVVANTVAEHSVNITKHAKSALANAQEALHDARVDTHGLDGSQRESLKKAEAKLREATKSAEYGELKKVKDAEDLKREQMQDDLEKNSKKTTELEQMRQEVHELRKRLLEKGGDVTAGKALEELDAELERMENDADAVQDAATNDEMKPEIERLRDQIEKVDAVAEEEKSAVQKDLMKDVKMRELDDGQIQRQKTTVRHMKHTVKETEQEATPVQEKGIDVDTQMPYGDLEPFGREDTAQELTENSVRESDEMVDQLERAEVAEEKRAVFRALTRLRGAAITSFDGVARSQTGNIDEYKVNKWRKVHPLHHLADEESDISKWAFPDNADLIQMKTNSTFNVLAAKATLKSLISLYTEPERKSK
jgi:hypothetical protein